MNIEIQSFKQNSNSPRLTQGEEGVAIAVNPLQSNPSMYMLNGVCRASDETVHTLTDTILHNVAIVCTFGPNLVPFAFPLVQSQVVFPEDIHDEGIYQTAFFNLNLSECGLPEGMGRYFVLASFHTFLSETIEFEWSK